MSVDKTYSCFGKYDKANREWVWDIVKIDFPNKISNEAVFIYEACDLIMFEITNEAKTVSSICFKQKSIIDIVQPLK